MFLIIEILDKNLFLGDPVVGIQLTGKHVTPFKKNTPLRKVYKVRLDVLPAEANN